MGALELTNSGNVVLLMREPCEQNINNYNPSGMLAWQANMDIQYVLNAHACVMYPCTYEDGESNGYVDSLKQVAAEARTEGLKKQLTKVGTAFLNHREVSAQEAVY